MPGGADYRGFTHRSPPYRGFTHRPESTDRPRRDAIGAEPPASLWITGPESRFSGSADSGDHPPSLRGITHRTISETLAGMVQKIDATLQRADALVTAARDGATPRHVVDRIVAAGGDARAEDRRTIATAAAELKDATRALQGVTASARRGYEQNRWLMWTAIGGVVLGMVLWAAFAGVVARAVPASWQWPEKMAARALDLSMWEGGQRMMQAASPTAFRAIIAADRMVLANRETIEGCSKAAARTRETVRCTIKVGASLEEQQDSDR